MVKDKEGVAVDVERERMLTHWTRRADESIGEVEELSIRFRWWQCCGLCHDAHDDVQHICRQCDSQLLVTCKMLLDTA